ncbi:MAG: hypothetical protein QNL04_11380 [SAR324 cluster bacterium]|nr:hypothetical protein [SAR324 cluster bacterium]
MQIRTALEQDLLFLKGELYLKTKTVGGKPQLRLWPSGPIEPKLTLSAMRTTEELMQTAPTQENTSFRQRDEAKLMLALFFLVR